MRVNAAVVRVPVICLGSHGRAHWVLAGRIEVPRNALIILSGHWRPPEKCQTEAVLWLLVLPRRANNHIRVGSHTYTCLSLELSLGDGAPWYQTGIIIGCGHWFLGQCGIIWLWISSGGIWSLCVLWLPGKALIDMVALSLAKERLKLKCRSNRTQCICHASPLRDPRGFRLW